MTWLDALMIIGVILLSGTAFACGRIVGQIGIIDRYRQAPGRSDAEVDDLLEYLK